MAFVFLTPCRPKIAGDVKTRISLAKSLPGLGLELVGPLDDYLYHQEKIAENLHGLSVPMVIHFPFDWESKNGSTDLSTETGKKNLLEVLGFAQQLGVKKVVCHAGVVMNTTRYEQIKGDKIVRQGLWDNLIANLREAVGSFDGDICMENMPDPLMGDRFMAEKEMIWDPFFTRIIELIGFCKKTGTKICFDTCHYGTVSNSILTATETLLASNFLGHIHLSDVTGRWTDGKEKFSEGQVPGTGNIGLEGFKKFFQILEESGQDLSITLEVADSNFTECPETKETIKFLEPLGVLPVLKTA